MSLTCVAGTRMRSASSWWPEWPREWQGWRRRPACSCKCIPLRWGSAWAGPRWARYLSHCCLPWWQRWGHRTRRPVVHKKLTCLQTMFMSEKLATLGARKVNKNKPESSSQLRRPPSRFQSTQLHDESSWRDRHSCRSATIAVIRTSLGSLKGEEGQVWISRHFSVNPDPVILTDRSLRGTVRVRFLGWLGCAVSGVSWRALIRALVAANLNGTLEVHLHGIREFEGLK